MSRPNIATPRQEHARYCHTPIGECLRSGDVRRCRHGRLQIAYAVLGLASAQWRDLDPLFEPIAYRRAKRAVE